MMELLPRQTPPQPEVKKIEMDIFEDSFHHSKILFLDNKLVKLVAPPWYHCKVGIEGMTLKMTNLQYPANCVQ